MSSLLGKFTTVSFVAALLTSVTRHVQATPDFEWTKVSPASSSDLPHSLFFCHPQLKPSESLNWSPCYSGLQCARFQACSVPLDYSAPDNGVAAIALVKYPSTAPKSQYLGPILINPGGPGSSGVDLVVLVGSSFATVLGAQFDLIGFDPRGKSSDEPHLPLYSTPIISHFKTDAERSLWSATSPPRDSIQEKWARAQLLGTLAKERDVAENLLLHVTTDNVARDMLRITEAFGFPKLQYYGLSYGTVLGATFASMFPDRVGRILIDGKSELYSFTNLTSSMVDADKSLQTFFDGCAAAGPEACPFYAPTAADIAANLTALTNAIKDEPIPVITNVSYGLFDFSLLRIFIFVATYTPYQRFPLLAQGLAHLAAGDAAPLYAFLGDAAPFECLNSSTPAFHVNTVEANIAIMCGDGTAVTDSVSQIRDFYAQEARLTSFADSSVTRRVSCSGWKVHREGRFQGPVGANTSFPLLVIGNTADPVTPLSHARKTASAFPGAVLLTQDSPGHTSTAAQSLCTIQHIGQYFQNGTLPAAGTLCPVDQELFPNPSASTAVRRSIRDSELLEASRRIGEAVRPILLGTMGGQ
ncbi:TAP-like protein-domain-containing protein [Mycena rebaudengoi]|nr:TAP-like protein-domain-containing protein [Mycena rebaudengoi]